jgi:hypothetical protein
MMEQEQQIYMHEDGKNNVMEETCNYGIRQKPQVHSAKGIIFNNMPHVQYVYFTKGQAYS